MKHQDEIDRLQLAPEEGCQSWDPPACWAYLRTRAVELVKIERALRDVFRDVMATAMHNPVVRSHWKIFYDSFDSNADISMEQVLGWATRGFHMTDGAIRSKRHLRLVSDNTAKVAIPTEPDDDNDPHGPERKPKPIVKRKPTVERSKQAVFRHVDIEAWPPAPRRKRLARVG